MSTLTNVSLRLPIELVERVNKLANATGRSKTYYQFCAKAPYLLVRGWIAWKAQLSLGFNTRHW
ncbi:TPA: ribbon-helix-helix protein, CopG family [Citrobacter freundii]|nr:ribbon-helix-helix protein, CopG family [Citrobacter freundii]